MAIQSKYNFVGGYEAGATNAGMLHVADHHISPGKNSGPGEMVILVSPG